MRPRVRFDIHNRIVSSAGSSVRITLQQAQLIEALIESRPGVLRRADAVRCIDPDKRLTDASGQLTVLIHRLRKSLKHGRIPLGIETVNKRGYRARGNVMMHDAGGHIVLGDDDLLMVQRLISQCPDVALVEQAALRFGRPS